jgi:hypothetical protein
MDYSRNKNFQQKDAATRQSKEDDSYGKEGFGIYRAVQKDLQKGNMRSKEKGK